MEHNNEHEEYLREVEEAYRYDNSIRSVSIKEAEDAFVTDTRTLGIWAQIYNCIEVFRNTRGRLSYDRVRLFHGQDPAMMAEYGAQSIEVFYRTADLPNDQQNVPFSPWPDLFIGEFFLLFSDGVPVAAVSELKNKLGQGHVIRRERITDHTQFPKTLQEARIVSKDHLWFPGTNVPVEDMTEKLYLELVEQLPDDQAF